MQEPPQWPDLQKPRAVMLETTRSEAGVQQADFAIPSQLSFSFPLATSYLYFLYLKLAKNDISWSFRSSSLCL
jgi:hypothetical protein